MNSCTGIKPALTGRTRRLKGPGQGPPPGASGSRRRPAVLAPRRREDGRWQEGWRSPRSNRTAGITSPPAECSGSVMATSRPPTTWASRADRPRDRQRMRSSQPRGMTAPGAGGPLPDGWVDGNGMKPEGRLTRTQITPQSVARGPARAMLAQAAHGFVSLLWRGGSSPYAPGPDAR